MGSDVEVAQDSFPLPAETPITGERLASLERRLVRQRQHLHPNRQVGQQIG